MKTYKLYLIRHGTTKANLDGIYCGSTDLPLCDEGRSELSGLLDNYSYPFAEWVFVSPLLRAVETAEILYPGCEHTVFENLREASFGEYEGVSYAEMRSNPEFQMWVTGNAAFTPRGAEPLGAFYNRCRGAAVTITDMMMRAGVHSAAIITHGSVIGNMLSALAYPKASPYDWNCAPGFGFEAVADPSLFMREPVLEVTRGIPIPNTESYYGEERRGADYEYEG